MAGEIQVNSVTALTESGSNIVLNNVDTATNRTNLGLGSMATQAADSVSISGGSITGTTVIANAGAVAASGTSVTITGIPSTARIVYVVFENVSKQAENMLLQLGTSSGIVTTGYSFRTGYAGGANAAGSESSSVGFVTGGAAGNTTYISGAFTIYNLRDYVYVGTLTAGRLESSYGMSGGGDVDLSGQLTQVKLSNTGGGAFDSGYFNLLWV